MSTTTRPSRIRSRPSRGRQPNVLLIGAIALVILAGLAALTVTLVRGETMAETPFDTAVATIGGTALTQFEAGGRDPAVGEPAPTIEGTDREGNALVAPTPGRATVLLFLAHWCPHCQNEVPVVQDWVEAGELPDEVDLVGVATATSSERPNYPPSNWLDDEGWTVPTIGDASGTAAMAYGLSAFPFWVAVDGDGRVVERRTGGLTPRQITQLARAAAAS